MIRFLKFMRTYDWNLLFFRFMIHNYHRIKIDSWIQAQHPDHSAAASYSSIFFFSFFFIFIRLFFLFILSPSFFYSFVIFFILSSPSSFSSPSASPQPKTTTQTKSTQPRATYSGRKWQLHLNSFFRRGLRAEAKAITITRRGGGGKGAHRLIRTQVAPLSLTCCSDRQVTLMSRWGIAAKKRNRHGRKGRR